MKLSNENSESSARTEIIQKEKIGNAHVTIKICFALCHLITSYYLTTLHYLDCKNLYFLLFFIMLFFSIR